MWWRYGLALLWVIFIIWLSTWGWKIPLRIGSAWPFLWWTLVLISIVAVVAWATVGRKGDYEGKIWMGAGGFVASAFVILIVVLIICSPMFMAKRYAGLIGTMSEPVAFTETDLPPFDPEQLPWVDEPQARVLGDKVLGELGAVGSSMRLGEYVRQEVNGKLYMVAPLLHGGFFKYMGASGGTPGYVMVSITNNDDVRLVTEVDDSPISIKYQPSGWFREGGAHFGDQLERLVYFYNSSLLVYEYKFEVDEEGYPYWVASCYSNAIGWGGPQIDQVLLINAMTGEISDFTNLADVPQWVDRIYPDKLVTAQLNWWGKYGRGFWNSLFGKVEIVETDSQVRYAEDSSGDKVRLSDRNTLVYQGGDCYLFTGLTSPDRSNDATIGFAMVNLSTKEAKRFSLAGATNKAARGSAEGDSRVNPSGYLAGYSVVFMIDGEPTYFFGLVDPRSQLNMAFALVNVQRHQARGIGDSIIEARLDYLTTLRGTSQTSLNTASADLVEMTGEVLRWGAYVQGGRTYYTFVIAGAEDKLLITDSTHIEANITEKGDIVTVSVMKTLESTWSVFSLDNLQYNQAMSETEATITQTEFEQRLSVVRENPAIMDDERFLQWWGSLSSEQQQDFLEKTATD